MSTKESATKRNLQSFLGISKVVQKTKASSNVNSSFKHQVSLKIKDAIHNCLLESYPNNYKNISANGFKQVMKDRKPTGEYSMNDLRGWFLIEKTTITNPQGDTIDGFLLMSPTLYMEGGKGDSNKVVDYQEVK